MAKDMMGKLQTQEMNMTNKVNIEFLREQLDKALADIEGLKDKDKENGKIIEDALRLIVKISEGSVRDSLSLLDRALLSLEIGRASCRERV